MEMRSFILLAFACGLALAQEDMFEDMFETVAPSATPSATPTPTSVPPNPHPGDPVEQSFFVLDAVHTSNICVHLTAAISVNITYINTAGKNVSKPLNLTGHATQEDDRSVCNATATSAKLYIELDDDTVPSPLYMVFEFTGNNASGDHWSLGGMTLTLDLDYLDDHNPTEGSVTFETDSQLHDSANNEIEFTRSYKCNSDQTLYFNKNYSVAPIVHINKLQVQAFQFKNYTSGEFDNSRSCLLDTRGKANKIVPIAVGAALAGLVVVVLIAYLIGRLRSRRQSSYEALS